MRHFKGIFFFRGDFRLVLRGFWEIPENQGVPNILNGTERAYGADLL